MGLLDAVTNDSSVNNIRMQQKLFEANKQRLDGQLENLKGIKGREGITKAAQGFSSLFVYQMLQEMRKTVPENSLFGGNSYAIDVLTSMLDEKIANRVAQRESMGLVDMVRQYLEKRYENNSETAPTENKQLKMPDMKHVKGRSNEDNISANNTGSVSRFNPIIDKVAGEIKLDPDLIRAVISKESSGNPTAISKTGAKGLMQLMDTTAEEMGVKRVFEPEDNIKGGAQYLKNLLVRYEGDLPLALAAYNAGPGAVRVYNGIPPYPETQNYVNSVLKLQQQFRKGEQI